jgi:hypothetical protein
MRILMAGLTAVAAAVLAQPGGAQVSGSGAMPACDRECLIALADTYAEALVDDAPGAVRWAQSAVVMENLAPIEAGAGAFDTITGGPTEYAIHVADPVSQQVGLLAMMSEGETPVMVGIRLQLDDSGAVSEAEHMIARDLTPVQLANLQAPRPALLREVPAPYLDSRERMLWLGRSYYDALDNNNARHSNMADDCERQENGYQTAGNSMVRENPNGNGQNDAIFNYLGGLGCAAQMDTGMWSYIDTIENRRVQIADPVTGLVWGMSHLHHDMAEPETPLYGVPWANKREWSGFEPFDMPAIHIYKVWGGAIHEIEALGIVTPYQSPHSFAD